MSYTVFYWDTFDDNTFKVGGPFPSVESAEDFIEKRYKNSLRNSGADRVDIVDDRSRDVVRWFNVG